MKKSIFRYISENLRSIIIFSMVMLCGIAIGLAVFQIIGQDNKAEITQTIRGVFDLSKDSSFNGVNIMTNGIASNVFLISIMILSVFTIIAPIILCGIYLFKGFALGVYISTIFSIFGFGYGILVILLIVVLPNIIYIPILIYVGVNEINLYYSLMDKTKNSKLKDFIVQCYQLLIAFSFIIVSVIIEQSMLPVVLNIYNKL